MKKLCVLPFIHSMVEPDGNIQLCCNSVKKDDPANIVNLDVSNILNNHVHTRVRKDMLEGKLPSECERCWKSEDSMFGSITHVILNV